MSIIYLLYAALPITCWFKLTVSGSQENHVHLSDSINNDPKTETDNKKFKATNLNYFFESVSNSFPYNHKQTSFKDNFKKYPLDFKTFVYTRIQ